MEQALTRPYQTRKFTKEEYHLMAELGFFLTGKRLN